MKVKNINFYKKEKQTVNWLLTIYMSFSISILYLYLQKEKKPTPLTSTTHKQIESNNWIIK